MALLSSSWIPLGNQTHYRKFDLYAMAWPSHIDTTQFAVYCAKSGGPIALIRDDNKFVQVSVSGKPVIHIFTSAGTPLAEVKWNSGRILKLGWSNREDLLCVQDDGHVLIYDIFGNFKKHTSLGQEAQDMKVIDCKVFSSAQGTGVAVMTSTFRIFCVNNIDDPRTRRMSQLPGASVVPTCWAVFNQDRQTYCLVCKQSELYLLDHTGQCQTQTPSLSQPYSLFLDLVISEDNRHLALFTDTGILWLGSADLTACHCEFDTHHLQRPTQLAWCGVEAVISYWQTSGGGGGAGGGEDDGSGHDQHIFLLVGTNNEWYDEILDGNLILEQELDGCRIITNTKHEMMQKVPDVTSDVLGICSMSAGAILLEASKCYYDLKSHKASEYLRSILGQLEEAVEQCLACAVHEYEPNLQKMLLKAASLGKSFLGPVLADLFMKTCRHLRVLNAVRDYNIALPLSCTQLEHMGMMRLIDRLVLRRHYCLALRICRYLRIDDTEGASRVLSSWACYKVGQQQLADDVLANTIAKTLGDTPGISYSDIAARAVEEGRTQLAIRLLDFEPQASNQVPLLMKMNKIPIALSKAVQSGDADLIYTVILHHKSQKKIGDFLMEIRNSPVAFSLYCQLCKQQNPAQLLDIYEQEDNEHEKGNCYLRSSYTQTAVQDRIAHLQSAHDCFIKAKDDFSAKQCEEQQRLLRYQKKLEEKFGSPYMDLSAHETMYNMCLDQNYKLADEFKKEFKVSDKRYWWCRIMAMAEAGDWLELEKFSKQKKSPIGYEPFIDVCMKYKNSFEAKKYLNRVLPENKVKYHVKAGQLRQAAELAYQSKSEDDLNYVSRHCTGLDRSLLDSIHTMRTQLRLTK